MNLGLQIAAVENSETKEVERLWTIEGGIGAGKGFGVNMNLKYTNIVGQMSISEIADLIASERNINIPEKAFENLRDNFASAITTALSVENIMMEGELVKNEEFIDNIKIMLEEFVNQIEFKEIG